MTDLNTLTKAAINALLAEPLAPAALKKATKADLIARFDAMDAADALAADLRDAREDATDPSPTLGDVINATTDLERRVLVAYLTLGIDCNGAETLDAMLADNMTWGDTKAVAKVTKLTQKQVTGVQSSLSGKGLLVVDCDPVNGEGPVQQVLSDTGIRVAFELLADVDPAKATKPAKAKPAPKARVLEDRIITPVGKLEDVKAVSDGSKKHKLAEALLRGATIEHLMEVTGWNRSTTLSALRWDVGQMGLGCERKGGKYFLIMPEGLKRLPLRTSDVTRADALVAACK